MRPAGARRGLVRSARALAVAALLALPLTAEAQTEITLVSNIGQVGGGGLTGPAAHSQGFDTGSNATGYILTGVDVVSDDVKNFALQVCETDSRGLHTSSCKDLTTSGTFAVGPMSFTAPPNTVLSTATTYAVVVTDDGTLRSWDATFTGDDDTGAADGWSIATYAYSQDSEDGTWHSASWALRIAVKGYARGTLSTDATLSGLSLGTGVTLSPTFASGTTIYTASVATAVDEVTVTPTTNHASATVEYLSASDATLEDADTTAPGHQVALGASTVIKVKVTAQDDTTTQTYQVTVTRAGADATLSGLSLGTGVTLSPTFASGTTIYTASVAGSVDEVTVTPTTNHASATVEYLSASDATLADADTTAPGHQVALGASTVIKVKVTAQDGTTTQTYQVTVTRAAPTSCTLNTGDLWCGVVTVGAQDVGGNPLYYGYISSPSVGSLTDDSGDQSFTFGPNTYTVTRVMVTKTVSLNKPLYFGIPRLPSDDVDPPRLSLHVGSDSFAFRYRGSYHSTFGYTWNTSYDWSSVGWVTVRLRALPLTPTNLSAAAGNGQVTLSWDAPASDSGVTGHEFRFKTTGDYPATWTQIANSGVGGANQAGFTVTGLTNETDYTFELHAVNAVGAGASPRAVEATPTPGICDRTQQVQDQIVIYVNAIFNTDHGCSAVNAEHLARLNNMALGNKGITSLQAGDFAGLTGVERLGLGDNSLTALPSGVFSDLTSMKGLWLAANSLTSLPEDLFSGLTNLEELTLKNNELETLPAGVFSGLTALGTIWLQDNTSLGSLPENLFSGLTSLRTVDLHNIGLTTLPAGLFSGRTNLYSIDLRENELETLPANVFSGLTKLNGITLTDNDLLSLPPGLFSGLTALQKIRLAGNKLSALPDGLFSGLTLLTFVSLDGNTVDPLPLTVTLDKVGTDQVRAKVLAGAPGAVDFMVTVANGTLAGGVTTLSVEKGSVDGTAVTVTRTDGTTAAVTADVDLTTQPTLAPGVHVGGYTFARAPSGLPETILPSTTNNDPVFDSATATRTVPENSAVGTNVGAVIPAATDADTGDTPTYSMGGADAASFAFDASTRQITTIANVDYNHEATKNSYSVTVTASDGNGGAATVAVTIDVTDVNEQSAKPAKPTLAAVDGSSTTLTASWAKPDLNGGPDIAGYALQHREGATGAWEDFAHTGTAAATTITGLTADTEYQVQVRAKNGETDSDWSDPSDAVRTNAEETVDNNPPVFTEGETTMRTVAESSLPDIGSGGSGIDVGAPVVATDADNDDLTYTLKGADRYSFLFVEATGQIRTVPPAATIYATYFDEDTYQVEVEARDGRGGAATINVTINVTDTDDGPPEDEEEDDGPPEDEEEDDGPPEDEEGEDDAPAPHTAAPARLRIRALDANADSLSLHMSWQAPNANAADVTGYRFRIFEGSATRRVWPPVVDWTPVPEPLYERNGRYEHTVRLGLESAYTVWLRAALTNGFSDHAQADVYHLHTVAVESEEPPDRVALIGNYPNPFNPSTGIVYELPGPGPVRLVVYDMTGREMRVLVDAHRTAGRHTVRFDAEGLSTGTYACVLTAGSVAITRVMVLVR